MSISSPKRSSLRMTARAGPMLHESAQHRSQRGAFPGWRWVAVAVAFPVAGLIGWKVGGRVDAVDAALVGGAGAVLFMLLSGVVLARFTPARSHVA
jgi:hypothetical protein